IRADRVLDPVRPELRHLAQQALGAAEGPEAVELEVDLDRVADLVADGPEDPQAVPQIGSMRPPARLGGEIERPDLHPGDALLDEIAREHRGLVEEGPQVLEPGLRPRL